MNYALHFAIYLSIYAIAALSLNMVVGYCGLLTLAHASYFAVGSYTYAIASLKFGLGFIPSVALGIAVAGLLSLAVSLPAWKFKDDFFVLISLAAQAILLSLFINWHTPNVPVGTWANMTNGTSGIVGIPKPAILGIQFATIGSIAALSVALAAGCGIISWVLLSSPWGRLLKSIRDDELAARGLGKNVRLAKIQVFGISCAMVAVAGAIYASYVSYIDPDTASLDRSILILSMVIVGGVGNFRGPLIGAFVLSTLQEALTFAHVPDVMAGNLRLLAYGLLLMVMMHFRPQGLAGQYRIE